MFGMKPAIAKVPDMTLTAVVYRGKKVFKKDLSPNAWNARIDQIFTAQNIDTIRSWPDKIIEL
jgi:hypothetical protein